ncbi:hypothetical protein GINT2_002167 [Glugoides intestinalis]
MDNKIPGSRRVQGIMTERMIDYSVCNVKHTIISEKHLEEWSVSDHIPVETIILWENKELQVDNAYYFDRPRLTDNKIIKKILNFKFIEERGISPQSTVDKFYTELNTLLKELKILNKKPKTEHRPNKKVKDLTIKRKETQEEEKKKLITKEIKQEVKEIKQEVKEIRREQYNKFISKGCEVMTKSNSRESWKWLKQVTGLNKITELNYPIMNKATGHIEHSSNGKAEIFRDHLSKLAIKEKTLSKAPEIMAQYMQDCINERLQTNINYCEKGVEISQSETRNANEISHSSDKSIRIRSDKEAESNLNSNTITLRRRTIAKQNTAPKIAKSKRKCNKVKKTRNNNNMIKLEEEPANVQIINSLISKEADNANNSRIMRTHELPADKLEANDSLIKISNEAETNLLAIKPIALINKNYYSEIINPTWFNAKRIKIKLNKSLTSSTNFNSGESTLNIVPENEKIVVLKANNSEISNEKLPNNEITKLFNANSSTVSSELNLKRNENSSKLIKANQPNCKKLKIQTSNGSKRMKTSDSSNLSSIPNVKEFKCSAFKEALKTTERSKNIMNANEITQSQDINSHKFNNSIEAKRPELQANEMATNNQTIKPAIGNEAGNLFFNNFEADKTAKTPNYNDRSSKASKRQTDNELLDAKNLSNTKFQAQNESMQELTIAGNTEGKTFINANFSNPNEENQLKLKETTLQTTNFFNSSYCIGRSYRVE